MQNAYFRRMKIGILSDTHGLLRPEALDALQGVDHILHAGDVGDPAILDRLASLAPLTVVRGNIDKGPWAQALPLTAVAEVGGRFFYLLHDIAQLDLDPAAAGFDVVVFGHSHRPADDMRDGVRYLNPGSAGPRRFSLPTTLVRMDPRTLVPDFIHLTT
ncbi:MAG: metallophosphoesterase family protein [Bacteroidia bacterium]